MFFVSIVKRLHLFCLFFYLKWKIQLPFKGYQVDKLVLAFKTKRNITSLPPYIRIHCVAPRGRFTIRVSTKVFLCGERGWRETDWWAGVVWINTVPTLTLNSISCRLPLSSIFQSLFWDLTVVYFILEV